MLTVSEVPPLPDFTLSPLPPVLPFISDNLLLVILPIVAYWAVSLWFHLCDVYDLWPQYRLHTPEELLKRNRVTRYEVVRDVVIQQIIQSFAALGVAILDPMVMTGKQSYEVASWAQVIRRVQGIAPKALALGGIDAMGLSEHLLATHPLVAGFLAGGRYPHLTQSVVGVDGQTNLAPAFAAWELNVAKFIYWLLIPAVQFTVAVFIMDTWQYFLHRAMHMNKWLYTTLHSRHHRLYVPYAFGALYNHPVEGFMLDTVGAAGAHLITGMTNRQAMWFFTCSTIKTVDDHCGYAFPWDPLQHITSNNAAYHDIHHQTWGVKSNFSQPFFTFWDRSLGTKWTGRSTSARYEKAGAASGKMTNLDSNGTTFPGVDPSAKVSQRETQQAALSQQQVLDDDTHGGQRVIEQEQAEERDVRQKMSRSTRRKTGSIDPKGEGLWGLTGRMTNGLHGRSTAILHTDGRH